ncbi:hypothetical protein FisN_1Lh463 [Fistulifera solaris]|uniref:Uncharacterized protein n=1 Tax=Fistulifera solaris TaxID=1519565 RepID=A0A1Z5K1Q4_FISSO|nr:hypothetical protein FisN_1Lh463 [Fistulifera solaris]|eukprot:GAX20056.1 hypothetical protein FisN_1Lh463 [Fistulifera solaris]
MSSLTNLVEKPKISFSARRGEKCVESSFNRALLDPSKFGWTAGGEIADLLPPHQRARRNNARTSLGRRGRKRRRQFSSISRSSSIDPDSDVRSLESERVSLGAVANDQEGKVEKQSTCTTHLTENITEAKGHYDEKGNNVTFSGLSDDGKILDTYMYHRGRLGDELRDESTGALLCDVEPTDTNNNLTEPKLKANVVVEFPLGGSGKDAVYKEIITWDLGDDSTSTPLRFATEVAQKFGLSFKEMHKLSESIQSQLRAFVQDNCSYSPPVSLQSEFFQEKPQSYVPCLYGEVTGEKRGGAWYSTQKPRGRKPCGIIRAPQPEKIVNRGRPPGKRKRESFSDIDGDIEDSTCVEEIQRRLLAALEDEAKTDSEVAQNSNTSTDVAMVAEASSCHLCDKEMECRLPCSIGNHAVCFDHLKAFFPSATDTSSTIQYCPICTLRCDCKSCSSILHTLCRQFRFEHDKQAVAIDDVSFDDILDRRRTLVAKTDKRRGKRRVALAERPSVPKVPPADFPREVFKGVDIDPGSDVIYATVYTKEGSFVSQDTDVTQSKAAILDDSVHGSETVVEDGSVDYCNVCMAVGNLLCCDFCPRAFHRACIADDSIETSDLWECPSCRSEKTGMVEDVMDGSKYSEQIMKAFDKCESKGVDPSIPISTFSIIYAMLVTLMDYDFGKVFRDPVDVVQFPSYLTIVKNPMDLGTIAAAIVDGIYFDRVKSSATPIENALIAILKDLELVWHNCFIFNREGSAVYRMAQVQKRRATSIRSKSFDHLLSRKAKEELSRYEMMLEQERQTSAPTAFSTRPPVRHKIVATSAGTKGRPIAVLDPDTGRVIKLYATMQTIAAVMNLFLHLNYPCEWDRFDIDNSLKIRRLILMASENPKILIFGYRWVFLDDLQKGLVSFDSLAQHAASDAGNEKEEDKNVDCSSEAHKCGEKKEDKKEDDLVERETLKADNVKAFIEVCLDEHSYFFDSVERAFMYVNCRGFTVAELEDALSSVDDYVSFDGNTWRKISLVIDNFGLTDPSTVRRHGSDLFLLPDLAVIKEDINSKQVLIGFRTVEAAYRDWLRTLSAQESNFDFAMTKEDFCKHFLVGYESVDGLRWSVIDTKSDLVKNFSQDRDLPGCTVTEHQNGSKRKFDLISSEKADSELTPMVE